MKQNKLKQNIIDQIKEAQIKIGYVKETVRLYYPAATLNTLMGTDKKNAEELLVLLEGDSDLADTELGKLQFSVQKDRIEISVPPKGVEYVAHEVSNPAFLVELIEFFDKHHNCRREDLCNLFCKYSPNYVCENMPEGLGFDYVLYFEDVTIDSYNYCIKEEMGHTIYHRFTKEDYDMLIR